MGNLAGLIAAAPSTQILTDGYALEADLKGYYGTIRFWFLGADLSAFSTYAAGHTTPITINGTAYNRLIPLLHPYIANCYCDAIKIYPPEGSIAGLDAMGNGIAFTDYFADVHFSTPDYQYEGGTYPAVSISLNGGVEMVTRPGTAYKMLSDGQKVNHDVGVPVQTVDFTLTMQRLPSLNAALYFSLAGYLNSTTFFNQDPGKVLYLGPGVQGQSTIGSLPSYDVAHSFKFRAIEHNKIMRSDGSGFDTPVQSDGATPMLPSADLNQLWELIHVPTEPPDLAIGDELTADWFNQFKAWVRANQVSVARDSGLSVVSSPTGRAIGHQPARVTYNAVVTTNIPARVGSTKGRGVVSLYGDSGNGSGLEVLLLTNQPCVNVKNIPYAAGKWVIVHRVAGLLEVLNGDC